MLEFSWLLPASWTFDPLFRWLLFVLWVRLFFPLCCFLVVIGIRCMFCWLGTNVKCWHDDNNVSAFNLHKLESAARQKMSCFLCCFLPFAIVVYRSLHLSGMLICTFGLLIKHLARKCMNLVGRKFLEVAAILQSRKRRNVLMFATWFWFVWVRF